jgi:outer membrane protein assembly factor BamC
MRVSHPSIRLKNLIYITSIIIIIIVMALPTLLIKLLDKFLTVTFLVVSLTACTTSLDEVLPDRRPDYQETQRERPLEIPPDLTASNIDDTLVVPELDPTGSASLSDYAMERPDGGAEIGTTEQVLQPQPGMRIQRDGGRRWLVVQRNPELLWPRVKSFWTSNGLILEEDNPGIGIMETEWAENRADIADGPIRSVLSRFIDFAYAAPTRDKFRVRLERTGEDATDIYLTHYGLEETVQGARGNQASQTTVWRTRPTDPELEAEMLSRLMVYLGASERQAQAQLASVQEDAQPTGSATLSSPQPRQARLTTVEGQRALVIEEDYSRAWRLVGLALDSNNFLVENQDRAQGQYVVEYRDPLDDGTEKGFLSSLAFWQDEPPPPEGVRYQVRLAGQGPQTVVVVQNAAGQPDESPTAMQILETLSETVN